MHATVQKTLDEIVGFLKEGEKVFIVGCGNCAEKCRSGGAKQAKEMKERLEARGIKVVGYGATLSGTSLCKLTLAEKLLNEEHKEETKIADSFLVLACGQGVHTVIDATKGALVHPGCDTIFGGETESDDYIMEYCSLCGECIVEITGGLCPLTLCSKGLLNGPCGGTTKDGKCEADRERDCGWLMIYNRLKDIGKLELIYGFQKPKNHAKWSKPRSLSLKSDKAKFKSLAGIYTP